MRFTPTVVDRRRPLRALSCALLLAALAAIFALPAMARAAEERLPLIDKTESLGPGITLHHLKSLGQNGWQDRQVLTVHLNEPGVSTNLLTAGAVAQGGPLTEAANKAGAVAGVNGDFFDIGNSTAAEGGEVQNGELVKSGNVAHSVTSHFGVTTAGIAELANLAIEAQAEFNGETTPVLSINAADGAVNSKNEPISGVPANGMVAYTPAWGTYSRARGFIGVSSADLAEALVVDGKVVSIDSAGAEANQIPANGFALVGREEAATKIRALTVGEEVKLSYGLSAAATKELKFAIGQNAVVVENGVAKSDLDTSIAPRTVAGFKDGGHTLVLATWDGPGGTGSGGIGENVEAQEMAEEGVETAVNLDGGGSTTMVARALGAEAATVRNTPSDGQERSDPNGIGVFVEPGDGAVHHMFINPGPHDGSAEESLRVFPGTHLDMTAQATDNHQAPVKLGDGAVNWTTSAGQITDGVLAAPADAPGNITVRAASAGVSKEVPVRVLNPVHLIELSSERLSITEASPEKAVDITVTGKDDEGWEAPLEPQDLNLTYDHSVIEVTPDGGDLKITPLKVAGTDLEVEADGVETTLPITVGVETEVPYSFEKDAEMASHWKDDSTLATTLTKGAEGLVQEFPALRNVGITGNGAANRIKMPGQPLVIRLKLKSTITVPSGLTYLGYYDGNGVAKGIYGTALKAEPNVWQYASFILPAGTAYPVTVSTFQGINTSVAEEAAGTFTYNQWEEDVAPPVTIPPETAPMPEPLISDTGNLPEGGSDFKFATISDIQFTAENPALAEVARTAIRRIRQTDPDMIVLNGDVTDRGLPQDMVLAREVLEEAGCEIVPPTEVKPADYTPAPGAEKVPCYYVPGNHESYGLGNVQETLANFEAQFGTPYRHFVHKGTEFVLLASSLGTLRGTAWQQLPMFREALAEAKEDPQVHNVMVFAHHPVDDPSATKASQLGDREEVKLIEHMLTNFREASGKPAAMVGSHAQVAYVHQIEGIPYVVLPSSGKDPYGTPDHGGFTGWDDWSIDPEAAANQQWLEGNIHAFAQSITLNAPEEVEVKTSGVVGGSIVQPEGVENGTRVVPLRYPMSVDWGGSQNLAIGSGEAAIEAAKAEGKTAILDPSDGSLTGLAPGAVEVSVTNDSMRKYTGPESLEPITATKTVRIVPNAGPGPVFAANTPVFPTQTVGTTGPGQEVTVTDTGDEPLEISGASVEATEPASLGDFVVAGDTCSSMTVQPGGSCTVLVRFAPARADVTSEEALVFTTNTSAGVEKVTLTGLSQSQPVIEGPIGPVGPQGAAGPAGPQGVPGKEGKAGPAGAKGATGPKGSTGPKGATGATGPKGAPGRDATVRCEVGGKGAKGVKVTCKVTYGGRASRADERKLSGHAATLLRGGKVYAAGTVGHLLSRRSIAPGSYTMQVRTGTHAVTRFKIRLG
jgi:hypothetical protein